MKAEPGTANTETEPATAARGHGAATALGQAAPTARGISLTATESAIVRG